ncbi:MAG: DUF4124 domain-containing protein [Betaproteobacteria bacterium]
MSRRPALSTSPRRTRRAALVLATLIAATIAPVGDAIADICKYADAEGAVHYSNLPPEKGWKKLGCTTSDGGSIPRSASATTARSSPTPSSFPRVDPDTQKGRDDVRRKVLAEELSTEEKLLTETRTLYADGAPVPLPEERADAEKYRTRIARLKQTVNVHERNIEALKKELAAIK